MLVVPSEAIATVPLSCLVNSKGDQTLTLVNSTVSGNTLYSLGGGGAGIGIK
jgi:hypothetical protein